MEQILIKCAPDDGFFYQQRLIHSDDLTHGRFIAALSLLQQFLEIHCAPALEQVKERDLYILFARVLEGRSFVELSEELGIGYKTVAAVYYRMVAKIKTRGSTSPACLRTF